MQVGSRSGPRGLFPAELIAAQLRQGYALFREDIRDLAALTTDKAGG